MKSVLGALLLAFSFHAFASIVGEYKNEKEIMVMSETRESCLESQGRWEDELCLLTTSDDARIEKTKGGYNIHISTIATNYHTCEFEGPARLKKNTLISRLKTEEYDMVRDRLVEVTCEVKATIKDGVMSINTNDKCQSFCGANASLIVEDLKKVN